LTEPLMESWMELGCGFDSPQPQVSPAASNAAAAKQRRAFTTSSVQWTVNLQPTLARICRNLQEVYSRSAARQRKKYAPRALLPEYPTLSDALNYLRLDIMERGEKVGPRLAVLFFLRSQATAA
jgi:hypothetical protein